jgi:hypothetical protein
MENSLSFVSFVSFVEVSQLPNCNPLLFRLGCRGYKRLLHSLNAYEISYHHHTKTENPWRLSKGLRFLAGISSLSTSYCRLQSRPLLDIPSVQNSYRITYQLHTKMENSLSFVKVTPFPGWWLLSPCHCKITGTCIPQPSAPSPASLPRLQGWRRFQIITLLTVQCVVRSSNSFSLQWQIRSSLAKSIPLQHLESVIVYFMRLFCDNGPIPSWLKNGVSFCLACVLVCVCDSQNLYSFTNFMHTYYIGVLHMEFYQMKRLKSYTKR